jgi:hypothetical protein
MCNPRACGSHPIRLSSPARGQRRLRGRPQQGNPLTTLRIEASRVHTARYNPTSVLLHGALRSATQAPVEQAGRLLRHREGSRRPGLPLTALAAPQRCQLTRLGQDLASAAHSIPTPRKHRHTSSGRTITPPSGVQRQKTKHIVHTRALAADRADSVRISRSRAPHV